MEPHKIGHRRWNKSAAARDFHVHIRIGDNGASEPVHNLPVNARIVIALFFNNLERAALGQMPIASTGNRRRQHRPPILKQIRPLLLQIDFDAATSERDFYRSLLQDLRRQLPDKVPLSMTALASFCAGDRWLRDLPVDEAVPMIFRMGADDKPIKNTLASGQDFGEPLCRRSYGIALDEPLEMKFEKSRRRYVFNNRSWTRPAVESLSQGMQQ